MHEERNSIKIIFIGQSIWLLMHTVQFARHEQTIAVQA